MRTRHRLALAAAAGGFFALAVPPIDAWPAVFVSLALLAASWRGATPRVGFACGWLMGAIATLGGWHWLIGTVTRFTGLPAIVAVAVYVVMACGAGLTLGAAGLMVGATSKVLPQPVACALAVLVAERYAPSLFPWQLAMPLVDAPWIPQSADVLGASGLGAVLLGVMAVAVKAIATSVNARPDRATRGERVSRAEWVIAVAVFMLLWGYGAMQTTRVRRAIDASPVVRVALLQPAIPPNERSDEQSFAAIASTLRSQTLAAMNGNVDLVVWSEGAFPYTLPTHATRDGAEAEPVFPGETDVPILVGALAVDREGHRFNAALIREPDGGLGAPVAKRVLVPFGEYIPLIGGIPWVRRTLGDVDALTPGDRPEILQTDSGLALGVLNCFEDTLGYVAVDVRSADLLVNITNDAWFGRGAAPWQHLMLARWRSIELRREMVRAVNTGVTGRVDALGRLAEHAPLWESTRIVVEAHRLSLRPIAPHVLRFAPLVAAVVLAVALTVAEARRRRGV